VKIKRDFITNSSSTNFYFIFKGDHIDLYQRLLEHKHEFDLSYDTFEELVFNITTWDVIREIDKVIRSNDSDLWLLKNVTNIDHIIETFEDDKKMFFDLYKNGSKYSKTLHDIYYKEKAETIQKRTQLLKEAKKKGLSSYIMISFGDNHGDVKGDAVGTTMDYAGRKISINCPSFVVFTEQDR